MDLPKELCVLIAEKLPGEYECECFCDTHTVDIVTECDGCGAEICENCIECLDEDNLCLWCSEK